MRKLFILLLLSLAWTASATTKNDDSCDIAVLPAATLLLPYFEVDLDDPAGETTIFTITNVTNTDAIARVTLWTDRAYPVVTFNVYLTGYDVQPLDLYDILARGVIAPDAGTGTDWRQRGKYSDVNANLDLAKCARLPGALEDAVVYRMQSAFLYGDVDECHDIGGEHENAVGYATIDVVDNCSSNGPLDREYWTRDLRYDNVLIGDYQQINREQELAQGGPLVHIRAIPDREFPRTFYARYQPPHAKRSDARQPLPAQFAACFIEQTSFKIWREARTGLDASCGDYDDELALADVVLFDEQENATAPLSDSRELESGGPASALHGNGWMYLNFASQAWVISSMRAEGRYSTDTDVAALANGCTPPAPRAKKIEPAKSDDNCDIALLPAATLLLPYFEVDTDDPNGETTVFTITNISPDDRIARVTLWTDYSFPVLTFNVDLTGYDVQSISLYDVIERGIIATEATARGPLSKTNRTLDLSSCAHLAGPLPDEWIVRMQSAFMEGGVPDLGDVQGCNNVGNLHDNAVGYATIDVVRNCSDNSPHSAEYWTEDLAYDNVLIGDYQQVHSANDFAGGSPMVHIRAMRDVPFRRTFYARFQSYLSPNLDARQPLPSVFAARWRQGGASDFFTLMKIWREGQTGPDATCAILDDNFGEVAEIVTFDEQENAVGETGDGRYSRVAPTMPYYSYISLPATSLVHTRDASIFPQLSNGAIAGWVYLNLDNDENNPYYGNRDFVRAWPSQNWVVTSMRNEGRFSVDMDAAALGNGCSPQAPLTEVTTGNAIIGPRP